MKRFAFALAFFTALSSALIANTSEHVGKREEPYLVVTYTEGNAQVRSSNEVSWRSARIGDVLKRFDVIRTGREASVTLTITKGGTILVKEQSVLIFDTHEYDNVFKIEYTKILLRMGRARVIKSKVNKASTFFFATPNQVNRIEGTDFVVSTDGKTSRVAVFEGKVRSANARGLGDPVLVVAGKMSSTGTSLPPTRPETIPEEVYIAWNALDKRNALLREEYAESTPRDETEADAEEETGNEREEIDWTKKDESGEVDEAETSDADDRETSDDESDDDTQSHNNARNEDEAYAYAHADDAPPPQPRPSKKSKPKDVFTLDLGGGFAYFEDNPYNNGWRWWLNLYAVPQFQWGETTRLRFYVPFYFPVRRDFALAPGWYNYREWDFRTTPNWLDVLADLFSKFHLFEYDTKSFTFRLGSLPEHTFGNGHLFYQYASARAEPVIRKQGAYLKADLDILGIEVYDEDVFRNNFIGMRAFLRPFALAKIEDKKFRGGDTLRASLSRLTIGYAWIFDARPFTEESWTWLASRYGESVFGGNRTNDVALHTMNVDVSWDFLRGRKAGFGVVLDWGMMGLTFTKTTNNTQALPANFSSWQRNDRLAYYAGEGTNGVRRERTGINYAQGFAVEMRGYAVVIPWRAGFRYHTAGYYPEVFNKVYYDECARAERILDLYGTARDESFGVFVETGVRFYGGSTVLINYIEYFSVPYALVGDLRTTGNQLHIEVDLNDLAVRNLRLRFTYDRSAIKGKEFFYRIENGVRTFNLFNENTAVGLHATYRFHRKWDANILYLRRFYAEPTVPGGKRYVDHFEFTVSTKISKPLGKKK